MPVKPRVPTKAQLVAEWLLTHDEQRESVRELARVTIGLKPSNAPTYPRIMADLERCMAFIDAVPPARDAMRRLSQQCATWGRINAHWPTFKRTDGPPDRQADLLRTLLP
jgi:hypothetical protein